jgi:hypothetical protein
VGFQPALHKKEPSMKFLMTAQMSGEAGNQLAKQGKLGTSIQSVLDTIKPEAVYFGAKDGMRTMFAIVEMQDASQIPAIAEPLFLSLNAKIDFIPVMTPADLAKAGPSIEAAAKKFSL